MPRPPDQLLSDLARIWARYEPEEIQAALDLLKNPDEIERFASLVAQVAEVAPRQKGPRGRASTSKGSRGRKTLTADERLASIQQGRPEDAALLAQVLATADRRWTRPKAEAVAHVLASHRLPEVSGRSAKERRRQLLGVMEKAPRTVLEAIVHAFEVTSDHGGTLDEWSNIILPGRDDEG